MFWREVPKLGTQYIKTRKTKAFRELLNVYTKIATKG